MPVVSPQTTLPFHTAPSVPDGGPAPPWFVIWVAYLISKGLIPSPF